MSFFGKKVMAIQEDEEYSNDDMMMPWVMIFGTIVKDACRCSVTSR